MQLARYVVEAVIREGRSYREVAAAHGVSKSWVAKMVARYRAGGYEALQPGSKAPHRIPHRISSEMEDEIVRWPKQLTDQGLDAGAATIHYHLSQARDEVPSVATIWRVLKRRGFVTAQPHNGRRAHGSASKPNSPTNAGRPTSPTGSWPTAPESRYATCWTTTHG